MKTFLNLDLIFEYKTSFFPITPLQYFVNYGGHAASSNKSLQRPRLEKESK